MSYKSSYKLSYKSSSKSNLFSFGFLVTILTVLFLFSGKAKAETSYVDLVNLKLNAVPPANDPPQSFRVLAYHDIGDNVWESSEHLSNSTLIETKKLIDHFTWLKENGYHPVSLQQIIDAHNGKASLPGKAVLLTFDDGYKSVFTKVFPLLKLFNFPAVIAIVGKWIETPPTEQVQFGDKLISRDLFVTWDDLRTMANSGLVEVTSHTYNLHKGILANPEGNLFPAAVSRYYRPESATYESDAEYELRIKSDIQQNSDLFERELHQRPRAIVWPYGRYNQKIIKWAEEAGIPVTMNLEQGPTTATDSLLQVRRALLLFGTTITDLIQTLQQPVGHTTREAPLERVIHMDLDYIYDADPVQQEINLSHFLDRIKRLHPTTVYLQAFADPDGDGVADAMYFPNRHLPMRADLFSRVAWQLSTRTHVKVYAWMPVMAFKLPAFDPAASHVVQVMPNAPKAASRNRYHRLSLFDPLVRKTIIEIYEDLGKSAIFDGVLFHDDATLSDYEDANPFALEYYRTHWELPDSIAAIRSSPKMLRLWTEKKSDFIDAYTVTLANTLRQYQPDLITARNLYAQPVLNPASEEWFAQSLPKFLATYDFTAIMAMPYMEGADVTAGAEKWFDQLLHQVRNIPGALNKTVFELQSRDWKTSQPIPEEVLVKQMRQLHLGGARNFGYYPDDFHLNIPQEDLIKPAISVETTLTGR